MNQFLHIELQVLTQCHGKGIWADEVGAETVKIAKVESGSHTQCVLSHGLLSDL